MILGLGWSDRRRGLLVVFVTLQSLRNTVFGQRDWRLMAVSHDWSFAMPMKLAERLHFWSSLYNVNLLFTRLSPPIRRGN